MSDIVGNPAGPAGSLRKVARLGIPGAMRAAAAALIVVLVAVPVALGSSRARPAGAQLNEVAVSTPNLLKNPSFEQSAAHWSFTPGTNRAIYTARPAQDAHFLEWNTGSAGTGASLYQDVGSQVAPGHSYRATMKLRSPTSAPVSAVVALWALGGPGPNEVGTTTVNFSSRFWQTFSVDLDVANPGHTDLRLQIYLLSTGVNFDVDAANLADAGLANASFEQGANNWSFTPGTARAIYSGSAYEDSNYLEWNTGSAGAGSSVYQDVSTLPLVGQTYQGSMMLRSPSGAPVSAQLVLWATAGPSPSEAGVTTVNLSSTSWTRYSVSLQVAKSGFTDLRLQLYLNSPGVNLDVDAAGLTNAGLANSSFESGENNWNPSHNGMNWAVYSGSAAEDSNYLEMNTGSAPYGNITNHLSANLTAGDSYTAWVDLRSPSGARAMVNIRLLTMGKAPVESANTRVAVMSRNWIRYSVELTPTKNGYRGLKFRVGVVTRGVNVDVDAASVIVPHAPAISSGDPCMSTNTCTPASFAQALLAEPKISGPATPANVYALTIWEAAEGGGAGCPGQPPYKSPWSYSPGPAANPINTTQSDPGSQAQVWNSIGVQQYQNAQGQTCWYWGLFANYETLVNGYYAKIIHVLQNPASSDHQQCLNLAVAVGDTPWGTGNFSRFC